MQVRRDHIGVTPIAIARHFLDRLAALPLLRHAGLYVIFAAVAALPQFAVLPLLTRRVTPADYGTLGVFLALVNLLMPFVSAGMENAVQRRFVDRTGTDFAAYVTTAASLTLVLVLAVTAIVASVGMAWDGLIPLPTPWLWTLIVVAWGQVMAGFVVVLLQMEERPTAFGLWRLGQSLAIYGAMALVVLAGATGWRSLISAQAGAGALVIVLAVWWLLRHGYAAARLRGNDARAALNYGLPLIPHMLGTALIASIDRLALNHFLGTEAVGIYAAGYQLGQIMYLVAISVNRAWTPWVYAKLMDGSAAARRDAFRVGIGICAAMAAAGAVFAGAGAWLIPPFLGGTYAAATPVFAWIVAAFVVFSWYSQVSSVLFYAGRTGWISAGTITAAAANIALNIWLVPRHGMVGAAQATCAAYGLTLILTAALAWTTLRQKP